MEKIEVIAEIANAHQGNAETALELAKAAKEANADAVKYQIYFAEELLVKSHPRYEHFKNQAFSVETWGHLLTQAKDLGIKVYADVFGTQALALAAKYDLDGYKVHSTDLTNSQLIQALSGQTKPVFLATGGSTLFEIKYAVDSLMRFSKPEKVILLHGFQAYPTLVEDSKLCRIEKLQHLFGDKLKYGYSDHADAESIFATILPLLGLSYGIQYLEKHITFDRIKKGVDYYSSLEPNEFKSFVEAIRQTSDAIGTQPLRFPPSERHYRNAIKKGWVAARDLSAGTVISEKDIQMKRIPDFHATPHVSELIGKAIITAKKEEEPVTLFDIPHKVLAIIVARSASTRLPHKATLDINGKPVLHHLFERVKLSQSKGFIDTVAFCTTVESSDDGLVEIASQFPFKIYRGSIENVLSRMMLAIHDNPEHDLVLRITGDDILIDPDYLHLTIKHHLETSAHYTDAKKLPSGVEVEVFNTAILRFLYALSKDSNGTEYLTNYIRNNEDQFITASLPVEESHTKKLRLTMDTPEDFEVIKALLSDMKSIGKEYEYNLDDIYEFFEKNPNYLMLNAPIKQKAAPISVNTELNWESFTKSPKITVYITNYNYGAYIVQAIESVLNQKYKEFELIIIDDGSTDNSKELIERYRSHHKVTIIYQHNKGLNVSNNIALNAAQGSYLIRLDADDFLDENALLLMIEKLEKNSDLALIFPDYYLVDASGKVFAQERRHDFNEVSVKDQPAHGACTMIRKDVLHAVGGYSEEFKCQDGYDIWIKIINQRYQVANINLPLFYYRQHDTNLTKNQERLLKTRHEIIKKNLSGKEISKMKHIAVLPVRDSGHQASMVFKKIGEQYLLDIVIDAILRAENVSRLIITSSDKKILDYCNLFYKINRVSILERPESISSFNIKIEKTLDYLIDTYPKLFESADTLSVINLEYPLRQPYYIDQAINTLFLFNADSLMSVKQRNSNFFKHEGAGLIPFESNRELRLERNMIYEEIGGIHTTRFANYQNTKSLMSGTVGHIIMDELSAFKISSETDLEIAQYLMKIPKGVFTLKKLNI